MTDTRHPHAITVTDVEGIVRIEVDGIVVAESTSARVLREGSLPPRYYLPHADVRGDLLERTETTSVCPFKGEASYWTLALEGGTRHEDIVWSYQEPIESMRAIERMLSFYNDRVDLFIDGERQ